MKRQKVYIDPSCRIVYSSYYIKGLYEVFGKKNVKFSNKYFKQLKRKTESHSYDQYMAFIVQSGKKKGKYIIDFRDKNSIKKSAYEWCDKYAKINFSYTSTDKCFHEKIISIPPGFGIKIWGKYETFYFCILNYLKCNLTPIVSLRKHLADYYFQYKRPSIEDFVNVSLRDCNEPYIFLIGTLWEHENCIEGTNLKRKLFIEACKSLDIDFEGGFFSSKNHPLFEEFKHIIFTKRYSVKDYLTKTKKSQLVFNTPAVHNCHGWKLGEYLAMGKAIISTPLSNELPEDLVHGENIHIISRSDELREAISLLISDNFYRKKLEEGAKSYYDKYGSPQAVIAYITK